MSVETLPVYRAALGMAAKGVAVFPCAPNAKHPLTPHGLHDASTDPAVIRRWATQWPHAELAIATGCRSGLLVVDLDCKRGIDGRATLSIFESQLGDLPATLTAQTPSGGAHLYFRMPAVLVRNSAGKLGPAPAPGIDVRGDGGYVLCPPSKVDDRPYAWRARAPVAELPPAWVNALTAAPSQPVVPPWQPRDDGEKTRLVAWCVRALQLEAQGLSAAPRGTRNDRLWRAAAALGGLVHTGAFDQNEVRGALSWACSTWSERSAGKDARTLEGGLAFGLANPRQIQLESESSKGAA
jgi:hypothetical protein